MEKMATIKKLTDAMQSKTVVSFVSRYERGRIEGYVLDVGPKFFLMAIVDERIRFNGFQCMRLSDVRRLRAPDPYAEFIVAALRKRGEIIRKKPRVNLNSLPELLRSADKLFPLVTVHRERVDPGTCEIGRVVGITKSHVSMLEIGPDAIWEEKPTEIALRNITRVDFGGAYEDALHIVGGNPPQSKLKSRK